jgi:hypothetical protein
MGFLASTPFIGAGLNNFSHIFCALFIRLCRAPLQAVRLRFKGCLNKHQALSSCDAVTCPALSHASVVSGTIREPLPGLRYKKMAARGTHPVPPTVNTATAFIRFEFIEGTQF